MSKPFDPRQHVRQLDNGAPYLDVKWRLHWLRSEHPEAEIETELLSVDEESAVCKASVRIPGSGAATGHASASRGSNPSYIETAETRAIGRALAALGYGAEFVDDDLIASRPGAPPVSLVPSQPRQQPRREPSDRPERPEQKTGAGDQRQPDRLTSEPTPVRHLRSTEDADEQPPEPLRSETRQPREVRESPEPVGTTEPDAPMTVEEAMNSLPTPMSRGADIRARQSTQPRGSAPQAREDVSWTKFWDWARRRGYKDAQHLKDLLDIDVNAHTPGEVRDFIRRYEQQNPPDQS